MTACGGSRTLLFKITFLFSAISVVVLSLLGIIISKLIEQHFIEMDMDSVNHQFSVIQHELNTIRPDDDPQKQVAEVMKKHRVTTIVFDDENTVLYPSLGLDKQRISNILTQNSLPLYWEDAAGAYRGMRGVISTPHPDLPRANIIVGIDIQHHIAFMEYFHRILLIVIFISIFCLNMLTWVATRFVLSPLNKIAAKTSEVSSNKLDTRLDIEQFPYEFKNLATSLNVMLARLEDSFQRLSDFSSDLAHELRTPVSNMKVQTQVALMQKRGVEEYQNVLQGNIEELDQLTHMINDLLFLAKSENGVQLPHKESLDLAHEIHSLFEFYEALAEDRGIAFSLKGEATLSGDKLMLRRALSNLFANAINHAFTNTTVYVELERLSGHIHVTVSSQGEPIAPEHLPRLFDRFYRVDSARQRSSNGVGLGLAITRSIVQAHGGSIIANSEHGLTKFLINLSVSNDARGPKDH